MAHTEGDRSNWNWCASDSAQPPKDFLDLINVNLCPHSVQGCLLISLSCSSDVNHYTSPSLSAFYVTVVPLTDWPFSDPESTTSNQIFTWIFKRKQKAYIKTTDCFHTVHKVFARLCWISLLKETMRTASGNLQTQKMAADLWFINVFLSLSSWYSIFVCHIF